MKRLLFMLILLLFCSLLHASEVPQYAMPGTRVVPLKDITTGHQYELYIKLPEEYSKDKSYPVLYFTDAVWHIEALSSATFFLFDEVILVGISWRKNINTTLLQEEGPFVSRYADYSFTKSKTVNISTSTNLAKPMPTRPLFAIKLLSILKAITR